MFERLSQVGRCRGLHGWEVLGQWFGLQITEQPDHPQPVLQVPELLGGPHSKTFSASFSPHAQEIRKLMLAQLTLHDF